MKILVLRGGALGDFVVTLPALGLLRKRWPHAWIELAGNPSAARLGLCRGYLDAVHPQHEARWSRLGADQPYALRVDEPFASWLASFELVINYWPDPDGAIARDFGMLGFLGSGSRIFVSHPAKPVTAPAAAHFCEALRPLGLATNDFESRLFPTAADRAAAGARLSLAGGRCIAWHPGSGSPGKTWPVQRWLNVIRELAADHLERRLVVILGQAEAHLEANEKRKDDLPAHTTVLAGDPPEVLAAIFELCSLFLGHDTGPAHIAAAVGCRCVLVFGPTDPAMWAPPGPGIQALRHGDRVDDVSVPEVLAAARRALGEH